MTHTILDLAGIAAVLVYVVAPALMLVHHLRHPDCVPHRLDAELTHRSPR